ncbi:MAG: hypothetical protein K8J08_21070 [Thermoanaerobaculia bacterium]|nr:hypothetical protein [Thermoanaerobaculia bacterium]
MTRHFRAPGLLVLLAGLSFSVVGLAAESWSRVDLKFSGQVADLVTLGSSKLGVVVIDQRVPSVSEGEPVEGDTAKEADEETETSSTAEIWTVDLSVDPPVTRRLVEGLNLPVRLVARSGESGQVGPLLALLEEEVLDFGVIDSRGTFRPLRSYPIAGLGESLMPNVRGTKATRGLGAGRVGHLQWWPGSDLGMAPEDHPLPLLATPRSWGLSLSSPSVNIVADDGEALSYVVGPLPYGRRLRSVVRGSDGETFDAWSLMPGDEELYSSEYVVIDDSLFLLTTSTTERGIFTKLKLSLYPVSQDRSRSGLPPSLRWDLDCYSWFTPTVIFRDTDGDGRDDLLVAYGEGLGGGDLVLQQSRGLGGGRFSVVMDRKKMNLPGEDWRYGQDVDGDGVADLVVVSEEVEVYSGRTDRRLLERRSTTAAAAIGPADDGILVISVGTNGAHASTDPLSQRGGRLLVEDLNGDGVGEILVISNQGTHGVLTVLRRP